MLSLGPIGMDGVISEPCDKGTTFTKNYRKMTILWSFSYISFVKFHVKFFGLVCQLVILFKIIFFKKNLSRIPSLVSSSLNADQFITDKSLGLICIQSV